MSVHASKKHRLSQEYLKGEGNFLRLGNRSSGVPKKIGYNNNQKQHAKKTRNQYRGGKGWGASGGIERTRKTSGSPCIAGLTPRGASVDTHAAALIMSPEFDKKPAPIPTTPPKSSFPPPQSAPSSDGSQLKTSLVNEDPSPCAVKNCRECLNCPIGLNSQSTGNIRRIGKVRSRV